MKALIRKDVYVLWKQMKLFILVVLIMSAINSTFNAVFLVVWSSMLPYTAMAYDERSHWNQLAAMMPYRKKDLVLSKYVLGWLCMVCAALVCLATQAVMGLYSERVTDAASILVSLCIGVISLDLTLPAVLRFGVERGRMVFMLIIFGVSITAGLVIDSAVHIPTLPIPFMPLLLLAAVIATLISIPASMKLYREN